MSRLTESAFWDELEKIASEKQAFQLKDVKEWAAEHPVVSSLGVGGLLASGVMGRHLLRKAAPPTGAKAKELRVLAEMEGLYFATAHNPKSLLSKVRARVGLGGLTPIDTKATSKGVTVGSLPEVAGKGEVHGTRSMQEKLFREIDAPGKPAELSPRVGLTHLYSPGASIKEIAKKHGVEIPKPTAAIEEKQAYLDRLQKALKKEYGEFVMKPTDLVNSSGRFPTHEGNWGALLKDYESRLRPKLEEVGRKYKPGTREYEKHQTMFSAKHRDDPAYVGTALTSAIEDPGRALGQKMMEVVKLPNGNPAEYRIHMIGGEVPGELAYARYSPLHNILGRLPGAKKLLPRKLGTPEEAAAWARKNVAPNISKDLREGTYGMDVIRVKTPEGYDYRLVELNASTTKGASDFLKPGINPLAAQDAYKWITGKDAPAVATLKALAVGGAGAAGTAAVV